MMMPTDPSHRHTSLIPPSERSSNVPSGTISSLQTSTYHKPAAILIGTHFEKSKEAEFLAVDDSVQAMFENQWFMKNDTLRQVSKPGEKRRYIYFLNNVSGGLE